MPGEPDYRPVPGFPGYFVGRDGVVISTRSGTPRALTQRPHPRLGHMRVDLRKAGEGKRNYTIGVHILVAMAWDNGEGLVCHIDGDCTNNHASNLYYGSPADNARDREIHREYGKINPEWIDDRGLEYQPDMEFGF